MTGDVMVRATMVMMVAAALGQATGPAVTHVDAGRRARGRELVDKALAIEAAVGGAPGKASSDADEGRVELSQALVLLGDEAGAKRVIEAEPNRITRCVLEVAMADTEARAGRTEGARDWVAAAMALSKDLAKEMPAEGYPVTLVSAPVAEVQVEVGEIAEALGAVEGMEASPRKARVLAAIAAAQWKDHPAGAKATLARMDAVVGEMNTGDDTFLGYSESARAHIVAGDVEGARRVLDHELSAGSRAKALADLGMAWADAGRIDAARNCMDEAAALYATAERDQKLYGGGFQVCRQIAEGLAEAGEAEKGKPWVEKARTLLDAEPRGQDRCDDEAALEWTERMLGVSLPAAAALQRFEAALPERPGFQRTRALWRIASEVAGYGESERAVMLAVRAEKEPAADADSSYWAASVALNVAAANGVDADLRWIDTYGGVAPSLDKFAMYASAACGMMLGAENPKLHWLPKLPRTGNAAAMRELAQVYERGVGVPVDLGAARGWYEKAAGVGDGGAKEWLARHAK